MGLPPVVVALRSIFCCRVPGPRRVRHSVHAIGHVIAQTILIAPHRGADAPDVEDLWTEYRDD